MLAKGYVRVCPRRSQEFDLTMPIEIVANAKGSPMMLLVLVLLRLGAFMLWLLYGFFRDGEYSDL